MPAQEKHLYPFKLCQQSARLHGQMGLADLADLVPVLSSDHGAVTYDLMCGSDDEGIAYMRLHITADLPLLCQRCLQPLICPLDSVALLSPVRTAAAQQPSSYEPLPVPETGGVLLTDLLTEEIWLAIPQLPRHDADCVVQTDYPAAVYPVSGTSSGPFAALRRLQLQS